MARKSIRPYREVHIHQVGLSNVILQNSGGSIRPSREVHIQLCDLPNIIKQLQEIHSRVEMPHQPDVTGMCIICGNEVLSNESESSL